MVLYGAAGFVGSAVRRDLSEHGWEIAAFRAPRLTCTAPDGATLLREVDGNLVDKLRQDAAGAVAIVNAAGIVPSRSASKAAVLGANALLPAVLATVVSRERNIMLVHVSSSAVQGSEPVLRADGPVRPISLYAESKIRAESALNTLAPQRSVSLRPASVHGDDRLMTQRLIRLASSRLAVTARPGDSPTPQMHVDNVAAAIRFLLTVPVRPPRVVLQPTEGFTTRGFLELMGSGRAPVLIPRATGSLVSGLRSIAGRAAPRLTPPLRRVEVLLRGQDQEDSWLTAQGFAPPYGHDQWRDMVARARRAETADSE